MFVLPGRTRRSVLNGLAATAAVPALSRAAGVTSMAAAQAAPPISVTLLGTGTPQPRPDRLVPRSWLRRVARG